MQVLVTGSKGFIGKNLVIELAQLDSIRIDTHDRDDDLLLLESKINKGTSFRITFPLSD